MAMQKIGAVVIGRNEGERLIRCLDALVASGLAPIIYVDSGSEDGSIAAAQARGAQVVNLDTSQAFTAARARNAGFDALLQAAPDIKLVQFLDGDCEMRADWIATAASFLETHPDIAVVCGRRRERFPEASLYNRLTDIEWDTPLGEARACGGDALMRRDALEAVGGYNPNLIAGEEPELCVRLRAAGWRIWRLDAEMTWHDAALNQFSQFWKRAKRAGHAYAEGAAMHGRPPERHKVSETRRALLWGAGVPVLALVLVLIFGAWGLLILALYPLQTARLAQRFGDPARAALSVIGKFAEARGAIGYYLRRLSGGQAKLIEYK